jgi:hypothetical protein
MTHKRYSIYANATLDRVLAERLPHGDPEGVARSRSATITYMADTRRPAGAVCRCSRSRVGC